jgi:hypothetical protein
LDSSCTDPQILSGIPPPVKQSRRVRCARASLFLGNTFTLVAFVVTNLETDSRAVVRLYNKPGTAEQWIKGGKMTRLSCHRFRSNEVRLWLIVMAYNLGNLWRRLVLPRRIENWSLTSLQQRLVKTGGCLVKHARYYCCCWRRADWRGGCLGRWYAGLPRYRWDGVGGIGKQKADRRGGGRRDAHGIRRNDATCQF